MTSWRVIQGDCVEVMAGLPEASVDAVVCDPPYELGFMGKAWDATGVAYRVEMWAAALRVLKPGGHLIAFGGTRTYHRMTCAIEDAGFEIRDMVEWLYGSGFPKSHNLGGDWKGWGTALKPAHEPCVVARKSLVGTVAVNVAAHGTGAVNIDGCKIGWRSEEDEREAKGKNRHADFDSGPRENRVYGQDNRDRGGGGNYDAAGRWPANVTLDPVAAAMLDEQTGERPGMPIAPNRKGESPKGYGMGVMPDPDSLGYGDSGGASRFFYVAKPDTEERNRGLEGFEGRGLNSATKLDPRLHTPEGVAARPLARNPHPTVKPVELMRWLCRLVTPPGGIVLDPFAGSGTTGIAALREGFAFVGIEQDADYVDVARARIIGDAPLLNGATELVPENDGKAA